MRCRSKIGAPVAVLVAALGVVAIGFLVHPVDAGAWTPANLTVVSRNGHRFWTYDFEARSVAAAGCDWPVTIVFWGNATVAKVKQALSSSLPIAGNEMFLRLTPDPRRKRCTFGWAADRGVKTLSFSRALHVRLYADDDGRLSGGAWGDFVLATTHLDLGELSTNPTYGYSEQAAGEIEALCVAAFGADAVTPDCVDLANVEPERIETKANARGGVDTHVWQCDGLASLVYVP